MHVPIAVAIAVAVAVAMWVCELAGELHLRLAHGGSFGDDATGSRVGVPSAILIVNIHGWNVVLGRLRLRRTAAPPLGGGRAAQPFLGGFGGGAPRSGVDAPAAVLVIHVYSWAVVLRRLRLRLTAALPLDGGRAVLSSLGSRR